MIHKVKANPYFRLARDSRWLGGDGIASILLGNHKVVWLFGDSFIARDQDGPNPCRSEEQMITNSAAVHHFVGFKVPHVQYYWKLNTYNSPAPIFEPPAREKWLWVLSGIFVNYQLYLFLISCIPSGDEFKLSCNYIAKVHNPYDNPNNWSYTYWPVKYSHIDNDKHIVFGNSLFVEGGYVYIYGFREPTKFDFFTLDARELILARCPVSSFPLGMWEFFSSDSPPMWTTNFINAHPLFKGASTEMSVNYVPYLKKYIAIYSDCGLGPVIKMRFSDTPEGPWGNDTVIYSCPEVVGKPSYVAYAAKVHPEFLNIQRELLISYATNSMGLENGVLYDNTIYYPHFLQLSLSL